MQKLDLGLPLLQAGGAECRGLWEERTLLSVRLRKIYDNAELARTVSWAESHLENARAKHEAEQKAAQGEEVQDDALRASRDNLRMRKESIGSF